MPRRQIDTHTALRGIAALSVVAYHLQFGGGYHLPIETATPLWRRCYLFVDLFFILSGFIIGYANHADRATPLASGAWGRFLRARFARIYPLHLACLVAMAVLWYAADRLRAATGHQRIGAPGTAGEFVVQLLLLNAWGGSADYWNIPSWSISAEMLAYLLFPGACGLGIRARRLLYGLIAAIALAFYAAIAVTAGSLDIVAGLALVRCLAGFGLGMLIYYQRDRFVGWREAALSIVQLASIGLIVATLALDWNDVAIVPPFAALVATTWVDRGIVARLLVRRWTLFLGGISYSIYLTHSVILSIFGWRAIDPIAAHNPPLVRALYLIAAFALVILVSTVTYRRIELPARRRLGRWLSGHRPPPIETTPQAP